MHIFFTPDISTGNYTLDEEESKHCTKVLRLGAGDLVYLIDGRGGFYRAAIVDPHPKRTLLEIVEEQKEYGKRNYSIHIAVAPTKNIERFEWFLEKATEIGIDEITPIICERSERKEIKTDRLNKIITSAVKQSIKAYHPKLNGATKFPDFIASANASEKYIAHCMNERKYALKEKVSVGGSYLVLIGPEGDFTPKEVDLALRRGYSPVALGASRLRTETAALEACFEFNFLNR